jgi:hypothetical protein
MSFGKKKKTLQTSGTINISRFTQNAINNMLDYIMLKANGRALTPAQMQEALESTFNVDFSGHIGLQYKREKIYAYRHLMRTKGEMTPHYVSLARLTDTGAERAAKRLFNKVRAGGKLVSKPTRTGFLATGTNN